MPYPRTNAVDDRAALIAEDIPVDSGHVGAPLREVSAPIGDELFESVTKRLDRTLTDALARSTDWRSTFCAGSVIDARSGLTADDIDLIIANGQAITHIGEAVEHSLDA